MQILRADALEYHRKARPGKIAIAVTKPCATQRDLSLAYTPGVAEPVREIHADPAEAFAYTGKGNLVAVISNGTAVLALGICGSGGHQVGDGGQGLASISRTGSQLSILSWASR